MTGPTQPDSRLRRRMAVFALASLLLHAALLLLIQFAGAGRTAVTPEPVPVQFVELEPPPPAAPEPEPPVPQTQDQEIPEDQPPEIAPPPDVRPVTPPPEIPDQPAPEPEIPNTPPPAPEIPAPEPAPAPEPDSQPGAAFIAPEAEETEDAPRASAGIPGLTYDDGRGSDLAWFGHAIECMDLDLRYEEYCADIGPIYVADNVERLAPEIEAEFRALMARRNRYSGALDGTTGACEDAAGGDNLTPGACNYGSPGTLRDLMRQIQDATD